MSMNTNTPHNIDWSKTQINSLAVARLHTAKPTLSQQLTKAHDELLNWYHIADPKAVTKASARLFNGGKTSPFGRISNIMTNFSNELKRRGSPHEGYEGATIQSVRNMDELTRLFDEAEAAIEREKKTIRDNYDTLVLESQRRLSSAIIEKNKIEWPPVDELLDAYVFRLDWEAMRRPIEDSTLGKAVGEEVAARVRASSEQAQRRTLITAAKDPIEDLVAECGKAIEALTRGQRFRAERLDALRKKAEQLNDKNWLGIDFSALIRTIESLVVDPETIPDREARVRHAHKVGQAKKMAEKTLNNLGV